MKPETIILLFWIIRYNQVRVQRRISLTFHLAPVVSKLEICTMQIRKYNPDDYETVSALWEKAGIQLTLSDRKEELHRVLQYNPDLFLVGEIDAQIIAALMGTYDGRRAYVHHLAVDPKYQHQGLGTEMMNHFETLLKEKRIVKYHLMVERWNGNVVPFYEQLGWYERTDLILLSKDLRTPETE